MKSLHNVSGQALIVDQLVSGWGLFMQGGAPPLRARPAPQARGRALSCRLPSREGRAGSEKKSRNEFVCDDPVKGAATGQGEHRQAGNGAREAQ
jgi:hypothetical protein